jgi:hypothetical protein
MIEEGGGEEEGEEVGGAEGGVEEAGVLRELTKAGNRAGGRRPDI